MQVTLEYIGNAVNALTYGVSCLIYQQECNLFHECVLSIQDEYINMMHILIGQEISYLLKLHEINKVMNQDYSVDAKLSQHNIYNYIVLETDSFHYIVLAMKTQSERDIIHQGFLFFINEAKQFYQQLSEYNPFKAEIMMLFLEADDDGGNLLDIEETMAIFKDLNITKNRMEIEDDILEINKILYEHENIRKPKNFQKDQLTPLAFEYILKYYSSKNFLGKIIHLYCPMYRNKIRNHKNSIVDVVQGLDKPHISSKELKIFYEKQLYQVLTEQQCKDIIERFPLYDVEGKQKNEHSNLLSFNNMCNLLFSKRNSLMKVQPQTMNNPLTDYYIFTDFSTICNKKGKENQKNQYYEMILKRGSRCLKLCIEDSKTENTPVVRVPYMDKTFMLQNVLRIIGSQGFISNPYPIIVYLENNCSIAQAQAFAHAIKDIWQQHLYVLPQNYAEMQDLPSPQQLRNKILIMSVGNFKYLNADPKDYPTEPVQLYKLISLVMTKLDFQRKHQNCWNFCPIKTDKIITHEQVEEENLCDYSKKTILLAESKDCLPFDPQPMLRTGVQLIPVNHTIPSAYTYYLHSIFSQHCSGYLLKPEWMRTQNLKTQYVKNFDAPKHILQLEILCGQNIVINPNTELHFQIEVGLKGNQAEQKANKVYVSQMKQQGFYCQIMLQTQFSIFCQQIATVCISVINTKKDILGSISISCNQMQEGIRAVPLLNQRMQFGRNSYLLVKCNKKAVLKSNNNPIDLYK